MPIDQIIEILAHYKVKKIMPAKLTFTLTCIHKKKLIIFYQLNHKTDHVFFVIELL